MVCRNKTRSGYTLTELVVVVALVAIAAAVVTPAIARAFGTMQLRMAARTVQSVLAQARSKAVFEGRSYRVLVGPAENATRTLYLLRDDGKITGRTPLPNAIEVAGATADGNWTNEIEPIVFFADGTSQGAELEVRGGREQRVRLRLSGVTARAQVSQLYRAGEEPEAQP